MKRIAISLLALISVAGCQTTTYSNKDVASTSNMSFTSISSASVSSQFVNATAIKFDEIIPTAQSRHVTPHSHDRLRSEPACSRIVSLAFSSHYNYNDTMIALKNRAAILGGNALGVTNWIESSNNMYMVAHFYHCKSKAHI